MSTTGLSSTTLRTIGVVLLIVGLIALVIGIIYLVVPAHSLPSFMGRVHTVSGHRSKRAIASLVAGGLLVVGAVIALVRSRAYAH
jgi:hypothetical protein